MCGRSDDLTMADPFLFPPHHQALGTFHGAPPRTRDDGRNHRVPSFTVLLLHYRIIARQRIRDYVARCRSIVPIDSSESSVTLTPKFPTRTNLHGSSSYAEFSAYRTGTTLVIISFDQRKSSNPTARKDREKNKTRMEKSPFFNIFGNKPHCRVSNTDKSHENIC